MGKMTDCLTSMGTSMSSAMQMVAMALASSHQSSPPMQQQYSTGISSPVMHGFNDNYCGSQPTGSRRRPYHSPTEQLYNQHRDHSQIAQRSHFGSSTSDGNSESEYDGKNYFIL